MSNWSSLPDLPTARFDCGRVTLPNGDVLVFAGHDASNTTLTSSELLDHTTKTWSTVGPVGTGRLVPGVLVLNNGKVLTFGGSLRTGTDPATDTCEIYDPVAKTWSPTGSLITGRYLHANFLLADGTVLAAGGRTSPGSDISSSEIYDPNTGMWTATGSLPHAYFGMFYKTLGDGRPIVVGAQASSLGSASQTATFSSGTWTQQADFPAAVQAYSNSSASLSNGNFIVMCPMDNSGAILAINNAYIYNQLSNTWSTHNGPGTAHASTPARISSTQILLPGGTIGVGPFVFTDVCHIYDEIADTWAATDSLPVAGVSATQTEYTAPLLNGTTPIWVGAFSDIAINPTPYIFSTPKGVTTMSNSDASLYTLRYNEIAQELEAQKGLNWSPIAIAGGVTSVNSLTGAVTLAAGTNITITPSGNTLTIAASGGGSTAAQGQTSGLGTMITDTSGTPTAFGQSLAIAAGSSSTHLHIIATFGYQMTPNTADHKMAMDAQVYKDGVAVGQLDVFQTGLTGFGMYTYQAIIPSSDTSSHTYQMFGNMDLSEVGGDGSVVLGGTNVASRNTISVVEILG